MVEESKPRYCYVFTRQKVYQLKYMPPIPRSNHNLLTAFGANIDSIFTDLQETHQGAAGLTKRISQIPDRI